MFRVLTAMMLHAGCLFVLLGAVFLSKVQSRTISESDETFGNEFIAQFGENIVYLGVYFHFHSLTAQQRK